MEIVEQKTVEFYDDELIAVKSTDGHVYVSVRHLCDILGVARQGQVRRIKDHKTLSKGFKGGNVLLPPSEDGRGGGEQQTNLLRVDLIPLWLSGMRVSAVKEELRPKLEKLQDEAAAVLWEAFQEGRLTDDPSFQELLETDSPAVQAYKTFQALTKLARNQILLEGRVDDAVQRIEQIEALLGDTGRSVTPDQASRISQAVKMVAMKLGERTGRNEYGGVYGQLYRQFGITSYKELPAHQFEEAMQFLTNWSKRLEQ